MAKANFIEATTKEISLTAMLPTGFPSPANDYLEEAIDLNKVFIEHPLSTFLVTTEGDSMIDAFIPHQSILLVDKSLKPQTGDIIVAVLQGEFLVKKYEHDGLRCRLLPANKKYKPIDISEEMQMQVWGVVTRIFIDPKNAGHVCTR